MLQRIQTPTSVSDVAVEDGVYNYARNVIHLGLFNMVMEEMITKPNRIDGLRVLRFALVYFRSANPQSKYANEILRLLVHQTCTLSEQEAQAEYNGLFVNTRGKDDSYVASDLQMEYIVKDIKKHIKHMQSGQTLKNIQTHSTAICGLGCICEQFDIEAKTVIRCTRHKHLSDNLDILFLVDDLRTHQLFVKAAGRVHDSFKRISADITNDLDAFKLHKWLYERSKVYATELGN